MLTYATVRDFLNIRDTDKTGLAVVPQSGENKIREYLESATRFIERNTRRSFLPFIETKKYPIPYAYYDLAVRRFPTAHLKLGYDLLETITVNNGQSNLTIDDDYFLLEHNIYPKDIIAIRYPNYWGGSLAGVSLDRYDAPIITVTAIWGYADYRYSEDYWIDTLQIVEAGGIDASQTTLTFTNTQSFDIDRKVSLQKDTLIRIDNEFMEITNVSDTTITVIRGIRGSTAAAHDEDTKIYSWKVIGDIKRACVQACKAWRESEIAAGGRIGVSEMSAGAELGLPQDALTIIKSYQRSLL